MLRDRRAEVVAGCLRVSEELLSDLGAHRVASVVVGAGFTGTTPIETGEWIDAAGFEFGS
ncbi:MAG: hypothetical protein ACI8XO_004390 [Verrucomicrobiales bacterium]|jgi:hypothetical protein